jgi:hypothetical protein
MQQNISREDISDIYDSVKAFIDEHYAIVFNQLSHDYYDDLEELMENVEDSFAAALLGYIDAKGLSDPEVYRRAHMDKRLFNKIKNPEYHPSKKSALALAIALELNLQELEDLIDRAGYSLTRSDERDIIVAYCVKNGEYDILRINSILYAFGEQLFD